MLSATSARLQDSLLALLLSSATLAMGYLHKEAAEGRGLRLETERDQAHRQRQRLSEQMQTVRGAWREQQEQAHARELEVNDLTHRRDTLVERLREDYQLDLAVEYRTRIEDRGSKIEEEETSSDLPSSILDSQSPDLDAAQANEEIAELRRKLSRLGSVNLESLQELAELEVARRLPCRPSTTI